MKLVLLVLITLFALAALYLNYEHVSFWPGALLGVALGLAYRMGRESE